MDEDERRKAAELLKEIRQGAEENQTGNERLKWMYKGPNDLTDREEYLLGKAIDKTFEGNNNGDSSEIISRAYEPSNVPKRLLVKPESTEQVDIAKKILEDPLYAIKQKELEARRKLLDNPVKLKELKKMIMERNSKKLERKKQKKKKKAKDILKDEKALNKKILKKLRIFSESHRRKLLEEAAESSDSSSESDSRRKSKRKRKEKNKESSESESDNYSSSESDDSNIKRRKKKESVAFKRRKHASIDNKKVSQNERGYKTDKRGQTERENEGNNSISRSKRERYHKGKRKSRSISSSDSSSNSSASTSSESDSESSNDSSSSEGRSSEKRRNKRRTKNKNEKFKDVNKRSSIHNGKPSNKFYSDKSGKYGLFNKEQPQKTGNKKIQSQSDSDSSSGRNQNDKRNFKKRDRHDLPKVRDRSENFSKQRMYTSDRSYRERFHNSSTDSRKLSDREREAKLKEMMEDAKLRKDEREKNLDRHRKIQSEEDKLKDYDDGFMRRQISHATSRGTVADRIRSNVNNIQRSKDDMDKSFVRR